MQVQPISVESSHDTIAHSPLWFVLIACCLSAFLRLVIVSQLGMSHVHHIEDYTIAQNIVSSKGYTLVPEIGPTALKAPVYPLFLSAVIFLCPGHELVMIALLQHLLIAFCPLLFYQILVRHFSTRISLISALSLLLHPSYFAYPSTLEATNLFIPLALLSWWSLEYAIESFKNVGLHARRVRRVILSSVLLAVLCLTQPIILPIAIISAFSVFNARHYRILALAVVLLVWTPWTLRNAITFHRFIPFKSSVWMNVYMGFDQQSHGLRSVSGPDSTTQQTILQAQTKLDDVFIEELYRDASLKLISAKPFDYIWKSTVQCIRYWSFPPRYDELALSPSFLLGRIIPALLLLIGSVFVFFHAELRSAYAVTPIFLCLILFTLIYSFSHTQNIRFKLDVEWLQCLLFALSIDYLIRRRRQLRSA